VLANPKKRASVASTSPSGELCGGPTSERPADTRSCLAADEFREE
jgi:hypothetical protein